MAEAGIVWMSPAPAEVADVFAAALDIRWNKLDVVEPAKSNTVPAPIYEARDPFDAAELMQAVPPLSN